MVPTICFTGLKAKPNNVRFAHDIRNNRLLIKFDYDIFRKNEDGSTFTQKRNLVLSLSLIHI